MRAGAVLHVRTPQAQDGDHDIGLVLSCGTGGCGSALGRDCGQGGRSQICRAGAQASSIC